MCGIAYIFVLLRNCEFTAIVFVHFCLSVLCNVQTKSKKHMHAEIHKKKQQLHTKYNQKKKYEKTSLQFKGKELWDDETLEGYDINGENGSVFVMGQAKGGGATGMKAFLAPDVRKRQFTKTANHSKYKYYWAEPGLIYTGECLNEKCEVYKQRVACYRGFGGFSYSEDVVFKNNNKCPGFSYFNFFVRGIYFL